MSLDIYLSIPGHKQDPLGPKIYIREDGRNKEITMEEWNERFPDRVPVTFEPEATDEVFHANITHNLGRMADEAGIYKELWRPDEIGITKAKQLIAPLSVGLGKLMRNPYHFRTFNPENGWGTYESLVSFIKNYLDACIKYPDADVSISR